jgi:peroxiredoxin Q/BCP
VVYFYPKDDTPGCTLEAIEFSDLQGEFERLHTVVLGISRDDCLAHGEFRDKHGLAVRLLSDEEGEVCERYGVMHEREIEGNRRRVIQRSTFVVDKRGTLRHVMYGVNPRGHAHEVLKLVKEMGRCK